MNLAGLLILDDGGNFRIHLAQGSIVLEKLCRLCIEAGAELGCWELIMRSANAVLQKVRATILLSMRDARPMKEGSPRADCGCLMLSSASSPSLAGLSTAARHLSALAPHKVVGRLWIILCCSSKLP